MVSTAPGDAALNHTWILVDIFKSGDINIAWQHFVVVETCLMQLFITEQQNLKRWVTSLVKYYFYNSFSPLKSRDCGTWSSCNREEQSAEDDDGSCDDYFIVECSKLRWDGGVWEWVVLIILSSWVVINNLDTGSSTKQLPSLSSPGYKDIITSNYYSAPRTQVDTCGHTFQLSWWPGAGLRDKIWKRPPKIQTKPLI